MTDAVDQEVTLASEPPGKPVSGAGVSRRYWGSGDHALSPARGYARRGARATLSWEGCAQHGKLHGAGTYRRNLQCHLRVTGFTARRSSPPEPRKFCGFGRESANFSGFRVRFCGPCSLSAISGVNLHMTNSCRHLFVFHRLLPAVRCLRGCASNASV